MNCNTPFGILIVAQRRLIRRRITLVHRINFIGAVAKCNSPFICQSIYLLGDTAFRYAVNSSAVISALLLPVSSM